MKKLMLAICLCILSCLMIGCGKTSSGLTNEGVMVVGMECAYQPFNWSVTVESDFTAPISNQKNAFADGYDVQIAKKIAEALNLELKIKAYAWDGLIPALKSGDIDMIIAGMSSTAKRRQSIDFTNGYYTSEEVLLVRTDSQYATATGLSDFASATISGQTGTIYAELAKQAHDSVGSKVGTEYGSVSEILNEMKVGLTDAQVLELPVAVGICSAQPEYTYVQLSKNDTFVVSEEDVTVCIGVRKGFTYTEKINEVLGNITEESRVQIMLSASSRYTGSEE